MMEDLLGALQGGSMDAIAAQLGTDRQTAGNAVSAALPMLLGAMASNAQQQGGAESLLGALQRDHSGPGAMDFGSLLSAMAGGVTAPAADDAGAADASGNALLGGLAGAVGSVLGMNKPQTGAAAATQAPGGPAGGLGGAIGSVFGVNRPQASQQLDAGGILGHVFGQSQARAQDNLGKATGLNTGQSSKLLAILAPLAMAYMARQVSSRRMNAQGLEAMLGQERGRIQQQGGLGGSLLGSLLDQDGDGKFDMKDVMQLGARFLGGGR